MTTRKQARRGSAELDPIKVMFEKFISQTKQSIAKTFEELEKKREKREDKRFAEFEKRLDQKLEKMEARLEGGVKKLDNRVDVLEKEQENELDRIALLELRDKEFCLRLRGVPEAKEENLKDKIIQALLGLIDWEEEKMIEEIEKGFRINSRYAAMTNKPRDVLVQFARRKTRDKFCKLNLNLDLILITWT